MYDYRETHRAPHNDGDLQIALNNHQNKEKYFGSCRLTDFFNGYPAYGTIQDDLENMSDYDNGYSLDRIKFLKIMYSLQKMRNAVPKITIYRTVPNSVTDNNINNGDWITLSMKYAKQFGDFKYTDNYHILQKEVPINQIWWDGQHLGEFGFDDTPVIEPPKLELSETQKKYFQDSVIKDQEGNLRVVYHGTDFEFDSFSNIQTEPGYWFTEEKEYAASHGEKVLEVYLDIKNPFNMDDFEMTDIHYEKFFKGRNFDEKLILSNEFKDYLQREGFDGMIWDHNGYNTIIAFEPNQIKSVDNLYPTYDNNFRDNSDTYIEPITEEELRKQVYEVIGDSAEFELNLDCSTPTVEFTINNNVYLSSILEFTENGDLDIDLILDSIETAVEDPSLADYQIESLNDFKNFVESRNNYMSLDDKLSIAESKAAKQDLSNNDKNIDNMEL